MQRCAAVLLNASMCRRRSHCRHNSQCALPGGRLHSARNYSTRWFGAFFSETANAHIESRPQRAVSVMVTQQSTVFSLAVEELSTHEEVCKAHRVDEPVDAKQGEKRKLLTDAQLAAKVGESWSPCEEPSLQITLCKSKPKSDSFSTRLLQKQQNFAVSAKSTPT